jgi:TPP-dependent pyruvate/acetoin dehydrogenase alpha subunit
MALYHGVSPTDMMHNMFGNALDSARGRQMPVHFSFVDPIRFVSISSPIGTHIPQAVGAAHAAQVRGEDTVVLTSFGDGGTSSLGFHSGMNFAGVWKAPVVFLCQNNGWAISCSSEEQTGSDGFAVKAQAYGMPGVVVDGNDVLAVYDVMHEAVERAYNGDGATLVEAKTYRIVPHSSDDDDRSYRSREEVEMWKQRDPILRLRRHLESEGILSPESADTYERRARAEVDAAQAVAEAAPDPEPEDALGDVYAPVEA